MPTTVMAHLRKFCTLAMMASTLFTHAQCMRVHYADGWTEQIDVTTVDSITFDENKQHLAPTIMLNNGLRMSAFGIGTYSLHNETCFKLQLRLYGLEKRLPPYRYRLYVRQ